MEEEDEDSNAFPAIEAIEEEEDDAFPAIEAIEQEDDSSAFPAIEAIEEEEESSILPAIEAVEVEVDDEYLVVKEEKEDDDEPAIIFETNYPVIAANPEPINLLILPQNFNTDAYGDGDVVSFENGQLDNESNTVPILPKQRSRKENLSSIGSSSSDQSKLPTVSELLANAFHWRSSDPNDLRVSNVIEPSDPNDLRLSKIVKPALPKKITARKIIVGPSTSTAEKWNQKINDGASTSATAPSTSTSTPAFGKKILLLNQPKISRVAILAKRPTGPTAKNGTSPGVFRCSLCPVPFNEKSDLDAHVVCSHNDEIAMINSALAPESEAAGGTNNSFPEVIPPQRNFIVVTTNAPTNTTFLQPMNVYQNSLIVQQPQQPSNDGASSTFLIFPAGLPPTSTNVARPISADLALSPSSPPFQQPSASGRRCHKCNLEGIKNMNIHVNKFHPNWSPCLFSRCSDWFESPQQRARHLKTAHPADAVKRLPAAALSPEEEQPDAGIESPTEESGAPAATEGKTVQRRKRKTRAKTTKKRSSPVDGDEDDWSPSSDTDDDDDWTPSTETKTRKNDRSPLKNSRTVVAIAPKKAASSDSDSSLEIIEEASTSQNDQTSKTGQNSDPIAKNGICLICNLLFLTPAGLAVHMCEKHRTESGSAAHCFLCKCWYRSKPILVHHMANVHKYKPPVNNDAGKWNSTAKCSFCNLWYASKTALREHMVKEHRYVNPSEPVAETETEKWNSVNWLKK